MCIKRKFKKTGIEYSPFEWRFDFSVKHLIAAKFISTEDNRILELTEKIGPSIWVVSMLIEMYVQYQNKKRY